MKKKLLLHIGLPKTGSTAIQNFLFNNEKLLNEQQFSYPKIQEGKYRTVDASALDRYIKNGVPNTEHPGWKEFWETVREKLQKYNIILSWEGIFDYSAKEFFSAVLEEYDTLRVVVYLRRQDRFLESCWNQTVKYYFFEKSNFEDFILAAKFQLKYLDRLNEIANTIGQDNLNVRVYEQGQFQGQKKDVISDFLHVAGIELEWNRCVLDKPQNAALFGNYVEIKRRMNLYLTEDDDKCQQIDESFLRYIMRISSSVIKHAEGMLTPIQRQEIIDYYAKENAEIARKYLGREDGQLFYENKSIPMHALDNSTLCDDIQAVFDYLLPEYKQYVVEHIKTDVAKQLEKIQYVKDLLATELDNIKTKNYWVWNCKQHALM